MAFTGPADRDPEYLERRLKLVLEMLARAEDAVRQVLRDIDAPEEGDRATD